MLQTNPRKRIMKGTKRFAASDSASDTNDVALRNKRIMGGSLFDIHMPEPSQQQSTAMPPLDMQQAESSQQHVRALNTQFASWVHTQLKDHPDELWEDGVRDYLAHASNIMETFSDVVNWLRANAVKGGPAAESLTTEKKSVPEITYNENKLLQGKTGFAPSIMNTSCSTPWTSDVFSNNQSSGVVFSKTQNFGVPSNGQTTGIPSNNQSLGLFSNNQSSGLFSSSQSVGVFSSNQSSGIYSNSQTPILFGQSPAPANHNASEEVDEENELQQPSSPSVKKSEEKGIVVVHEVKCKLYVKSSDPADKDTWKDKGPGHLSIKCIDAVSKGTKESKPTIIVRNDVGKVLLNALLYPGIKTNSQKNSLVAIFHTAGDDGGNNDTAVARTFLIRTKTEEDRNKLATAIQEYAPAS